MSFWSDLVGTIEQAIIGNPAGVTAPGGPGVAAVTSAPGIGMVETIIGIWTDLKDGKMWRSLGWLLLGIALMFIGVAWWVGPGAARRSPAGIAAGQLT